MAVGKGSVERAARTGTGRRKKQEPEISPEEKAFAKALKMKNIVLPSNGGDIGFNLGTLF